MRVERLPLVVGMAVWIALGLDPAAQAQSLPRKELRTVHVGPTPGDPVASGLRLIAALASIAPSSCPGDNWLLWVAPGVYDLGGASLEMKPCVDVEGAGERATEITSSGDGCAAATVIAASHTELRQLTIHNRRVAGTPACALRAEGATMRLSYVTVRAGVEGAFAAVGITAESGSSLELDHVTIVSTGWWSAHGVDASGSTVELTDVSVVVSGDLGNVAVSADSSTLVVTRSRLVAPNGDTIASSGGLTARVAHTQLEGGLMLPFGLHCIGNYDADLAPLSCP